MPSTRVEVGAAALAVAEQRRAASRTTNSWDGGPNRSSTFCPGGGVKSTTSSRSPPAISVTGRWVVCANPSAARDAGQRDPGQPVRGGLDDDEVVARRRTAPLGSASPVASVVTRAVARQRRTAPL